MCHVQGFTTECCLAVLFTQRLRFTIVNKVYREILTDKTSDDYRSLVEQVKTEVGINNNLFHMYSWIRCVSEGT